MDLKPGTYYCTTRCNFPHRLRDGKPIQHECEVIPPAALLAEMQGDIPTALEIIRKAKPLPVMRRGLDEEEV